MLTSEDILNNEVQALSWKQPYADLMLRGKQETRSWKTNYRGLVLICASKKSYNQAEVLELSGVDQDKRIDKVYGFIPGEPYKLTGVAIGIGRLVDCRPMDLRDENETFVKFNAELFVHVYKDVREIIPFGFVGSQRWTALTQDQKRLIIFKP